MPITSGKKKLEQRELGYGQHQTQKSRGNGERTGAKADNIALQADKCNLSDIVQTSLNQSIFTFRTWSCYRTLKIKIGPQFVSYLIQSYYYLASNLSLQQ